MLVNHVDIRAILMDHCITLYITLNRYFAHFHKCTLDKDILSVAVHETFDLAFELLPPKHDRKLLLLVYFGDHCRKTWVKILSSTKPYTFLFYDYILTSFSVVLDNLSGSCSRLFRKTFQKKKFPGKYSNTRFFM